MDSFSFDFKGMIARLQKDYNLKPAVIERASGLSNGYLKTKNPTLSSLESILTTYPQVKSWLAEALLDKPTTVAEPPLEYETDLKVVQGKLIKCMEEREQLKIFFDSHSRIPKLKPA